MRVYELYGSKLGVRLVLLVLGRQIKLVHSRSVKARHSKFPKIVCNSYNISDQEDNSERVHRPCGTEINAVFFALLCHVFFVCPKRTLLDVFHPPSCSIYPVPSEDPIPNRCAAHLPLGFFWH